MSFSMNKNRIEAFSDGVIAIIITIMVLELHIPELKETFTNLDVWTALLSLIPKILAYLLSFIVVAILWLNLFWQNTLRYIRQLCFMVLSCF